MWFEIKLRIISRSDEHFEPETRYLATLLGSTEAITSSSAKVEGKLGHDSLIVGTKCFSVNGVRLILILLVSQSDSDVTPFVNIDPAAQTQIRLLLSVREARLPSW